MINGIFRLDKRYCCTDDVHFILMFSLTEFKILSEVVSFTTIELVVNIYDEYLQT